MQRAIVVADKIGMHVGGVFLKDGRAGEAKMLAGHRNHAVHDAVHDAGLDEGAVNVEFWNFRCGAGFFWTIAVRF